MNIPGNTPTNTLGRIADTLGRMVVVTFVAAVVVSLAENVGLIRSLAAI